MLGDDRVALDAAHEGLKVTGARWRRYAWLPVPEARALKHALAHARRVGHRPRISIATFLVDVCRIPQKQVGGSLIWPSSRVGFRTVRRRRLIHEVARSFYGTGPRRWAIDRTMIHEDRRRRAILWEAWMLVVIVSVIFIALELARRLLDGSP
jgi:hypothetical protein